MIPAFVYQNEGILYPLIVAISIMVVTAVEHRHKLADMAVFLRHQVDYKTIAVELGCWSTFLVLGAWAFQTTSDGDPSVLLTVAAALELFAFLLAWLPLRAAEQADFLTLGLSSRFCALLIISHALRLSCTTQFQAYLPVDATGNWIYQALEAGTALSCLCALAYYHRRPGPELIEAPWSLVCAAVLGCALASRHVYGDLAERPAYDQLYAASIYLEVCAWLVQAGLIWQLPRHRVNGNFLIPVTMHAACRAYFWNLAYPEISPQKPVRMMESFPDAQAWSHYLITASCAAMCVLCLLKVPGVEELRRQVAQAPAAAQQAAARPPAVDTQPAEPAPAPPALPRPQSPKPTPVEAKVEAPEPAPAAPKPAPAAPKPVEAPKPEPPKAAPKPEPQGYRLGGVVPGQPGLAPQPAAPAAKTVVAPAAKAVAAPAPAPVTAMPAAAPAPTGLVQRKAAAPAAIYPEFQGTLPAGCTHFVPMSAGYDEHGLLQVEYVPMRA